MNSFSKYLNTLSDKNKVYLPVFTQVIFAFLDDQKLFIIYVHYIYVQVHLPEIKNKLLAVCNTNSAKNNRE